MGPRLIAQEKLRKIGEKGGDKNKKAAWPRTRAAILSQYIYNSQLVKMHVASFLYSYKRLAFSLASSAAGSWYNILCALFGATRLSDARLNVCAVCVLPKIWFSFDNGPLWVWNRSPAANSATVFSSFAHDLLRIMKRKAAEKIAPVMHTRTRSTPIHSRRLFLFYKIVYYIFNDKAGNWKSYTLKEMLFFVGIGK